MIPFSGVAGMSVIRRKKGGEVIQRYEATGNGRFVSIVMPGAPVAKVAPMPGSKASKATAGGHKPSAAVVPANDGETVEYHLLPIVAGAKCRCGAANCPGKLDALLVHTLNPQGQFVVQGVRMTIGHETIALHFRFLEAREAVRVAAKKQATVRGKTEAEKAMDDLTALVDVELATLFRVDEKTDASLADYKGYERAKVRRILIRTGSLGLRMTKGALVRDGAVSVDETVLRHLRTIVRKHYHEPETVARVVDILYADTLYVDGENRKLDAYQAPGQRTANANKAKGALSNKMRVRDGSHGITQERMRSATGYSRTATGWTAGR